MACRCELRRRIKDAAVPFVPERTVYLDYNATAPTDPRVLGAFERACRRSWGNPSSLHSAGSAAWTEIEALREAASDFFSTAPEGFHFCSNGTEALSALSFGLAARRRNAVFFTTEVDHQAVRHPLFHLGRRTPAAPAGFAGGTGILPVDSSGRIDPESVTDVCSGIKEPVLIYSPVNHETGAVQPVEQLYRKASSCGAVVILDAVQAAARLAPSDWTQYCDAFCISGHKICAPKGTALLWKKPELRLSPLRYGGSQEAGLFPGTENIPGAAALAEALRILKREQPDELRMLTALSRDGLAVLERSAPPFTAETPENAAPGVICISLDTAEDMERIIFGLNKRSICLSRFSACTERISGPSRTLLAMGRPLHRAERSIRISLGRWSRRDDFFRLSRALNEVLTV